MNIVDSFEKELSSYLSVDKKGYAHSNPETRKKASEAIEKTFLRYQSFPPEDREKLLRITDRAISALELQSQDIPFHKKLFMNLNDRTKWVAEYDGVINLLKYFNKACLSDFDLLVNLVKEIGGASPEKKKVFIESLKKLVSHVCGENPFRWLVEHPQSLEIYLDAALLAFPERFHQLDNAQKVILVLNTAGKGNEDATEKLMKLGAPKLIYIPDEIKLTIEDAIRGDKVNILKAFVAAGYNDFSHAYKIALNAGAMKSIFFLFQHLPPNEKFLENNYMLLEHLKKAPTTDLKQKLINLLKEVLNHSCSGENPFKWLLKNPDCHNAYREAVGMACPEKLMELEMQEQSQLLLQAAEKGNIVFVKWLSRQKILLGYVPKESKLVIENAVKNGDVKILKAFARAGFNDFSRFFEMAVARGSFASIKFLIKRILPEEQRRIYLEKNPHFLKNLLEFLKNPNTPKDLKLWIKQNLVGAILEKRSLFNDLLIAGLDINDDPPFIAVASTYYSHDSWVIGRLISPLLYSTSESAISSLDEATRFKIRDIAMAERDVTLSGLLIHASSLFKDNDPKLFEFISKELKKGLGLEDLLLHFGGIKNLRLPPSFIPVLKDHNVLARILGKPEITLDKESNVTPAEILQVLSNRMRYQKDIREMQEDLLEDGLPRPFYPPEDLNAIQVTQAHMKEKVQKDIPEPPANVDIRTLNRLLAKEGVKKRLSKSWLPEKFIEVFSSRINALVSNQSFKDIHQRELPNEYRHTIKKIFGWIAKRFEDMEKEVLQLEKLADSQKDPKIRQQFLKKSDEFEAEIARVLGEDFGKSLFYCHSGIAHELKMLYYQMDFENPAEAVKAYESDLLPNKIKGLLAKHRLNLFDSMFVNHPKVPVELRPEYAFFYHNMLAEELGLGSKEFSSVKTEYLEAVNPDLTSVFHMKFLALYHQMPQWFHEKINDIDDKEIPKQLVTEWIHSNYPDASLEELTLPNGKWKYSTVICMLHDMGIVDWPSMNLPISQRLEKIKEHRQSIDKCQTLEDACRLSLKILKDSKRLLGKELALSSPNDLQTQQKLELELEEQHKTLLTQMEQKVNQLFKGFEAIVERIKAESSYVEVDHHTITEALNRIGFVKDAQFSEHLLKKFQQFNSYISELKKTAKSLEEKKFILELKLISGKLADGCLEKDITHAETLLKRLTQEKFAQISERDKTVFIKQMNDLIKTAKEQIEKNKSLENKAKEALEKKRIDKEQIESQLKAWDAKLNPQMSSEEFNKIEKEATGQPFRRKVNLAEENDRYRQFLSNLYKAKKQFVIARRTG